MGIIKLRSKAGQESVWDYPRPPRLEPFTGHIRIVFNEQIIFDAHKAFRMLETSHPPTYYLPIKQFKKGIFVPNPKASYCEFKGMASYFDILVNGKKATQAAWYYKKPNAGFEPIKDTVSIYAHIMDACYVNDEKVKAQDGEFYGGWITSNILGPFKGGAGTWGW